MNETTQPAVAGPVEPTVRRIADARQRPQCQDPIGMANCKNMKCTYEGFDGERYRCEVCGCSYFLDYEEMR